MPNPVIFLSLQYRMPTPETLRVFEMFDAGETEEFIVQYINNNQARIDVNYVYENEDEEGITSTMLEKALEFDFDKVMKRVLDLGSTLRYQTIDSIMDDLLFSEPVGQATELMTAFINAGLPKENMLHVLCNYISQIHKVLLKKLLEQPLNVNHKYSERTALHRLITVFSTSDDAIRGIFMEMLQELMNKGANPNLKDWEEKTAIQLVNEKLAGRNPGPILAILQPAPAPAPAAPGTTPDYQHLWLIEIQQTNPKLDKLEEYKTLGNLDMNAPTTIMGLNSLEIYLSRSIPKLEILEALLQWGANPNLMKKVPVYFQIFDRSLHLVKPRLELFIKYGADLKLSSPSTNCIFYFIQSIQKDDKNNSSLIEEIVDIMIANGADIHFKNETGEDILDRCINKYVFVIELFIKKGLPVFENGRTRWYKIIKNLPVSFIIDGPYINPYIQNIVKLLQATRKYHANHNDFMKDFLDAALVNFNLNPLPHIYQAFKQVLTFRLNELYTDTTDKESLLIKAVKLYGKLPKPWVFDMIESFVAEGADLKYVDSTGKKAVDYTTDKELNELLDKPFQILWTGFSKADIDFTNNVFHQVTHPENLTKKFNEESLFSICPVCLKHIAHENQTCMYMTHSCVEQAGYEGYYHKKLWKAFSYKKQYYANGALIPEHLQKLVIEWCTLCGRICRGHKHYALAPIYKADGSIQIPALIDGGDYYATTCAKPGIGGGGIKEKINRYRRFREVVITLNKPDIIGKIPYDEAINTLVEAVWEAPLDPRRFEINRIEKLKKFNINNFPLPSGLPKPPKYIYSIPTYPDVANPELMPLVFPKATAAIKNSAFSVFGSDENIVQFRHRMADGKINNHEGPNQQVALDRLMGQIKSMTETPNSEDFGMCWQHKRDAYNVPDFLNDKAHKPKQCTAKLYPEELLHILQTADYRLDKESNNTANDNLDLATKAEHMGIYEYYTKLFLKKFGKPIGLAPTGNNNANNGNAANRKEPNSNNEQGGGRRRTVKRRKIRRSKTRRY